MEEPILSLEDFVPEDTIREITASETYPLFCADISIKNKLKTTYLTIDNKQYRLYYKYSATLGKKIYYCGFAFLPFEDKDGNILWVAQGQDHKMYLVTNSIEEE